MSKKHSIFSHFDKAINFYLYIYIRFVSTNQIDTALHIYISSNYYQPFKVNHLNDTHDATCKRLHAAAIKQKRFRCLHVATVIVSCWAPIDVPGR